MQAFKRSAAARAGPRVLGPRARRPDSSGRARGFAQRGAMRPSRGSERDRAEAGGLSRRALADPPARRRLRRVREPTGGAGPRRSDQGGPDSSAGSVADGRRDGPGARCPRVRATALPHTPPPAGSHSTGRSAAEEEAGQVTARRSLRRRAGARRAAESARIWLGERSARVTASVVSPTDLGSRLASGRIPGCASRKGSPPSETKSPS